jgi:copper homeostasis protein
MLEACVTSVDDAVRARAAGAHRLELCARLAVGGLTPRPDTVRRVRHAVGLPLAVMVRPRAGDYVYDGAERLRMLQTVEVLKRLGADRLVLGALTAAGDVDADVLAELLAAARPLPVTFHRAFDVTRDRLAALDTLIGLGVDAVLTSGGAHTAARGVRELARLVARAHGRITVIAAGSIRAHNVRRIVRETGVTAIHAHTDPVGLRLLAREALTPPAAASPARRRGTLAPG